MRVQRRFRTVLGFAFSLAAALALPVGAQDVDCTKCHADLAKRKVVHAAMQMGCKTCHDQLDASSVPHKSTGKAPKGLSAEPAVVCARCHEAKLFQGKLVHGPVAAAPCASCHDPHSSEHAGLLVKAPAALCLDCHGDVKKKPHMIVGFSGGGHPLGDEKRDKPVVDPLRIGKPFYCVACHEPHRSERPRLMRFDKGMASCQQCHKM